MTIQRTLTITALLLLLCASACGGGDDSGPAAGDGPREPMPLLAITEVTSSQAQLGGTAYQSTSSAESLHWSRASTIDPHDLLVGDLSLGAFLPHQIVLPGAAGATGEVWILGRTTSAPIQIQLRSYLDSDANGIVEVGSYTTLFASTGPTLITSAVFSETEGTLYMLDQPTYDIYRAYDTGTDERPDTLASAIFAAGTWVPGNPTPQTYTYIDPDTSESITLPNGRTSLAHVLASPSASGVDVWAAQLIGRFADTNWDGVADSVTQPGATLSPLIAEFDLTAGMNSIQVRGHRGAALEVRRVDDSGSTLEVLGSTTLADTMAVVALTGSLTAGQRVRVADTTNALQSGSHKVSAARAYVFHHQQIVLKLPASRDIIFQGVNLASIDSVRLLRASDPAVNLSLTFTVSGDGRTLTATVPNNAVTWDGYADLQLRDDELDPPLGPFVATLGCTVCGQR